MAPLLWTLLAAMAILPPVGLAAAPRTELALASAGACRQAVSHSRMVCLSGAHCQQEISPVLRSCRPTEGACAAAHEELRAQCGRQLPWYGSRECRAALEQVSHYCAREPQP